MLGMLRTHVGLGCWLLSRATKTAFHERSTIETLSKVPHACASNEHSGYSNSDGEFF